MVETASLAAKAQMVRPCHPFLLAVTIGPESLTVAPGPGTPQRRWPITAVHIFLLQPFTTVHPTGNQRMEAQQALVVSRVTGEEVEMFLPRLICQISSVRPVGAGAQAQPTLAQLLARLSLHSKQRATIPWKVLLLVTPGR